MSIDDLCKERQSYGNVKKKILIGLNRNQLKKIARKKLTFNERCLFLMSEVR